MFDLLKRKQKTEQGVQRTKVTWFNKLTQILHRPGVSEDLWQELEELLLGSDMGVSTTRALLEQVKKRVEASRSSDPESVRGYLKGEILALFKGAPSRAPLLLTEGDLPHRPSVILVVGVNGTGKTTTIAKLAHLGQEQGKKVILAAADTFRAAAIDQLKVWADREKAGIVAHQSGADPGAVAYDAYQAAKTRDTDFLIIDTAGRLHTKSNLMEELKKVHRVVQRLDSSAPHEVLLVIDATTGQNGLTQAKAFMEAVNVTGIVLAKLDGTARGGIALAIASELKLPILFIGTGEKSDDLSPFSPEDFVEALFS